MKRRKVIQQIGLGLSAGLVLPAWLSSCSDDAPAPKTGFEGDVAIVGAGAAGLYIADILKARGVSVVLLEASDRVGGRVRSLKSTDKPSNSLLFNAQTELSSDFPNELGAGLVKGSDSSWGKIVQQLKLTTVDISATTTDNYFLDGAFVDSATIASDPDFIAAKNFVNALSTQSGTGTVEQAIIAAGINSRMLKILNSWISNPYETSNDHQGIQGVSEASGLITRNNTLLTLSDNPMQDALLSRFSKVGPDVILNSTVKAIDYTGATVTVSGVNTLSAEPFSFEVKKVIVTVPVSILKKGMIVFTPALPAKKTAALDSMAMDPCLRVLLDFKANFWGDTSGFLFGGTQAAEYFNCGVGRSELTKTLAITVSGDKAATLSGLGKGAINVLLGELDSIFAGKATLHVRRDINDNAVAVIQDWSLEPFILGGGSYPKPGGTNQHRKDLGEAVSSKVFFAGEATDTTGEFGTIDGALLSAERAALEVIATL